MTWTSADTTLATVSNGVGTQGLATATNGTGSTTITATLGALTASTTLNVSCQVAHNNGVGQTFYDCNALGTYTESTAIEAAQAYTGNGADTYEVICPGLGNLPGVEGDLPGASGGYVWYYSGNYKGWVVTSADCLDKIGSWN